MLCDVAAWVELKKRKRQSVPSSISLSGLNLRYAAGERVPLNPVSDCASLVGHPRWKSIIQSTAFRVPWWGNSVASSPKQKYQRCNGVVTNVDKKLGKILGHHNRSTPYFQKCLSSKCTRCRASGDTHFWESSPMLHWKCLTATILEKPENCTYTDLTCVLSTYKISFQRALGLRYKIWKSRFAWPTIASGIEILECHVYDKHCAKKRLGRTLQAKKQTWRAKMQQKKELLLSLARAHTQCIHMEQWCSSTIAECRRSNLRASFACQTQPGLHNNLDNNSDNNFDINSSMIIARQFDFERPVYMMLMRLIVRRIYVLLTVCLFPLLSISRHCQRRLWTYSRPFPHRMRQQSERQWHLLAVLWPLEALAANNQYSFRLCHRCS